MDSKKIILILMSVFIVGIICACSIASVTDTPEDAAINDIENTKTTGSQIETSEENGMTDSSSVNATENTAKQIQPTDKTTVQTTTKTQPNPIEPQPTYPNGLDPATEQKIIEDYIKYIKSIYPDSNITKESTIIKEFIGSFTFGNVFFPSYGIYAQVLTSKEIAGYGFGFPDTTPLLVHTNSTFYEIEEAYKSGIITKDEVGQIHKAYSDPKRWFNND